MEYIREQNRTVFEPLGIIIGDPMDRGLRCVSFRGPLKGEQGRVMGKGKRI